MRFEEILPLMREGKAARMESNTDGYHWIACKQGAPHLSLPNILSIVELNKDGKIIADTHSWGIPRWAIMADDWVICDRAL